MSVVVVVCSIFAIHRSFKFQRGLHDVIDLLHDLEPTVFLQCATVRISLVHSDALKR